eukprot:CAMPEP_0184479236 /NCGR_PEP_ID=MMETSP0113_2-20130426/1039_1 /TAXON_ID=91329 /ORGANISM="Norrisiella sphaerica, Strain BC52" /LENGTH=395 /DNA_ID=CAMNT_0026857273 /DNA_START=553 /DNA_END=1740 /DNA_ORIENTATION=+
MKAGTTIISTPLSLCPSPLVYQKLPLIGIDKYIKDVGYGDDYILAVLIEFETHKQQTKATPSFGPYVSTLPTPPLPMLYNEELTDGCLDGTYCGNEIKKVRAAVKRSYERLFVNGLFMTHPDLFSAETSTLQSWSISLAKVWSRSYNLFSDARQRSDSLTWAMVPLADLVNHDLDATNNYIQDFDAKPDSFKLRLAKDVEEGEEILISYGTHTSLQYFLFYGFVLPRNPFDYLNIHFYVPGFERHEDGRKKFQEFERAEVNSTGIVPLRLLAQAATVRYPDLAKPEAIQKTATWLRKLIQRRFDQLPTSREQDLKTIQSLSMANDDEQEFIRTMTQLKLNHKNILQNMISYLESVSRLSLAEKEIQEMLVKGASSDPPSLSDYGLPIDNLDVHLL